MLERKTENTPQRELPLKSEQKESHSHEIILLHLPSSSISKFSAPCFSLLNNLYYIVLSYKSEDTITFYKRNSTHCSRSQLTGSH